MTRLHLYGRRDCHLCAEMRNALLALPVTPPLVEHDVDAEPELVRQYGARVPVLVGDDGTEICQYFLDTAALLGYMDRQ
jgi:glutathione S-transferase